MKFTISGRLRDKTEFCVEVEDPVLAADYYNAYCDNFNVAEVQCVYNKELMFKRINQPSTFKRLKLFLFGSSAKA
jgi:hypothetical protein